MPLAPLVPDALTQAPFTLDEARRHGLTEDHLRGASWRRIDRGVFAWRAIADRHLVRLGAAVRRLPEGAAFSGHTAGWLYGLDLDPCSPIEVTVPIECKVTRRAGMIVRRSKQFEVARAHGLPVTTRLRTAVDLVRRSALIEAVSILDMALHRRVVTVKQMESWIAANPRGPGVARVRCALDLAEPATESPMETRLRLLLVMAGLPRPLVQARIRNTSGSVIARADLCYPTHRLAIEYDGATHKDSIVDDSRRQNRLYESDYQLLRFTAQDVFGNPTAVVSLVRKAIARPLDLG